MQPVQVFGCLHSVSRRHTAIVSRMGRSTMLALAVGALLAVVASAQPGVVLFAEGENQGALLHTPSPGSQACAEDPHADCAPLEPSAAAAAVAALLRVNPVESVDAHASSQVRSSPTGPPGNQIRPARSRPLSLLSTPSASLWNRRNRRSPSIHARSHTTQAASLLDRDPSHRPGTVIVAHVASARAASALEDFLAAGDDASGAASRDQRKKTNPGISARRTANLGDVRASLDALACAPGVSSVRVGDADIGDPAALGDAVARAVAASHSGAGAESARATLALVDAAAGAFSGGDGADDADVSVVFASARGALERACAALGGDAVLVVLVSDGEDARSREQLTSRRRLQQDANATSTSSNGNATAVAEKTRRFRDASAMFAVFFLLLVIAACGIMAMMSMTFPSDSLLYPREKID